MFVLKLFGVVSLEGAEGPLTGAAVQRHRLALLALLAVGRTRGLGRDKVMATLWPDRDQQGARALLNQAVHAIRRELGAEVILSAGEELQLNAALISCDVLDFETAVSAGALERAASLYTGPFLDGFFLDEAAEFEQWAAQQRERLATTWARVLESRAEHAEAERDWPRAVEGWKLRATLDPLDSRVVGRLMLALDTSGNRAAALLQAEAHHRRLKEELGMDPSPELQALADRLRTTNAVSDSWLPHPAGQKARDAVPLATSPAMVPQESAPSSGRPPLRLVAATIALAAIAVMVAMTLVKRRPGEPAAATVNPAAVDAIASAVARQLQLRERGDTGRRSPAERTTSIAAYELYLRGSDPVLLRSESSARQGLEYMRQAVALDSGYAAGWAGFARFLLRVPEPGLSKREHLIQAERAALRAVALDDSLGEGHAALAAVRIRYFDLAGAETHLHRAISLEPGASRYRDILARVFLWTGRPKEALAEARSALEREPFSSSANAEVARSLIANGKASEALIYLGRIASVVPPLARAPTLTAFALGQQGRWIEAAEALRPQAEQGFLGIDGLRGYALARAGKREEAKQIADRLRERARADDQASWPLAMVYLGLGDLDQAAPLIERAMESQWLHAAVETAQIATALFDSLRRDPRVARLRLRGGLTNP